MDTLHVSEIDYGRLMSLLEEEKVQDLENELERASVLHLEEIPEDLVTMNSRFYYVNETDNKVSEMTLVYPPLSDVTKRWISVTAPLGTAFLGLKVGDAIKWRFPDGKERTLRVLEISYQPEHFGDFHL